MKDLAEISVNKIISLIFNIFNNTLKFNKNYNSQIFMLAYNSNVQMICY